MIKKLLKSEKGVALIMVMAFTALSLPTVVGARRLASTLSLDSRAKTDALRSQYAALGGQQHGRFRVVYDASYMAGLSLNQVTTETIILNGKNVTVTFVKTAEPPPPPVFSAETGREILVQKTVSPSTASAGVETTFTFTITMPNFGPSDITLSTIYDQLPGGFTYVEGSTSGSLEPSETIYCLFGSLSLTITAGTTVNCNIGSNGDVIIEDNVTIVGNVASLGGSVQLGVGATVQGGIRTAGNMDLQDSSGVTGDMLIGGNLTCAPNASSTGSITVGGNVQLQKNTTVTGDIVTAVGNFDMAKETTIIGNVTAGGYVNIKKDSLVQGNVVAGGYFTMNKDGRVTGNITAGGDVVIKKDSLDGGDIVAGGNLTVKQDSQVAGNVTVSGTVSSESGVIFSGTVTEGAPPPIIPPVPVVPPIQVVSITPVPGPAAKVVSTTVPQISGTLLAGYLLKWQNPAAYLIRSGGSAILLFQAKGTFAQGVYCNEAWVDPGGASNTSTGLTAGIVVGFPASTGVREPRPSSPSR